MKHRFRILLLLAALGSIARAAEPQIPWRAVNTGAPASVKSIGVLTPAANKLPYYTDATTAALADLSAFARTLLDDADATAARATLGVVIGTNVAPATSGTALLYGNGSGGFSNATVGGNLSFSGGTLNLSATPNVGAATGTSLSISGNATVGGGGLIGAASTLALTGSGATTFRLDLAPTAANSSASSTIYNQPLASAGTASYARIGLLSGTNSRNLRIDTGGNGGATAGDIEIAPGSGTTAISGNVTVSGNVVASGASATGLNVTSTFGNINSSTAKTLSLLGADAAGIGLKWQRSVVEKPFYVGALSGTDVVLASEGSIRITANVTADTLTGTTAATFTNTGTTIAGNLTASATGNATSTTNGPHRFGSNIALSGTAGGASYFGGKVVAPDIVLGGATANVSATSTINAQTEAGALAFDGSDNAKAIAAFGSQPLGTDGYSVVLKVRFPSTSMLGATNEGLLFGICSGFTNNAPNGMELKGSGSPSGIEFRQYDGTGLAGGSVTADVAAFAGKTVIIVATRSGSTGKIYLNAVDSTTVGGTYSGQPMNQSITQTVMRLGSRGDTFGKFTGQILSVSVYNVALTQAEVAEVQELGGGVPFRYQFGSQAELLTNADFAASTGWTLQAGWTIGSGVLTGADVAPTNIAYRTDYDLVGGKAYRAKLTVNSITEGAVQISLTRSVSVSTATRATAGTLDEVVTMPAGATGTSFVAVKAFGETSVEIDNVSLTRVGAVVHYDADRDGIGYQLHDQSTNKLDATITTTGVSWTKPARDGYVRATLTFSASHAAQSLLGQAALESDCVVEAVTVKSSVASSGSGGTLGTTNSATRYLGTTTYTTAKTRKRGDEISNGGVPAGTAAGDLDLVWDPDTANVTGTQQVHVRITRTEGNP